MASERKVIEEATRRVLLKDFLVRESARAGFGGLDIQRTPMGTRVTLICERPGILIGRRGELIKQLTQEIQGRFQLDNPQIEVQEERQPALNAQLMAEKLAATLERGWHFRRAGHSTVRRIMESGARGCQVILSGKLTGERHRTERFRSGMIKYCGEAALLQVEKGFYPARLKPGVIGVSVWIMRPNIKLSDEIHIKTPAEIAAMTPAVPAPVVVAAPVAEPVAPAGT
ncbi:MAG: 30S ribosomal protein S3 [Thermoplasmata archaeon]|nr:30S ribosomal protein S3 [Thermoplasmata archaeon]MCI4342250.1 30S ribosomal protein S3 [Thermoplasmata archaeon]